MSPILWALWTSFVLQFYSSPRHHCFVPGYQDSFIQEESSWSINSTIKQKLKNLSDQKKYFKYKILYHDNFWKYQHDNKLLDRRVTVLIVDFKTIILFLKLESSFLNNITPISLRCLEILMELSVNFTKIKPFITVKVHNVLVWQCIIITEICKV